MRTNCLHGKVPGHEFDDGAQASHGGSSSDSGESVFGNGRVNDTLGTKLAQQSLGNLSRNEKLRNDQIDKRPKYDSPCRRHRTAQPPRPSKTHFRPAPSPPTCPIFQNASMHHKGKGKQIFEKETKINETS